MWRWYMRVKIVQGAACKCGRNTRWHLVNNDGTARRCFAVVRGHEGQLDFRGTGGGQWYGVGETDCDTLHPPVEGWDGTLPETDGTVEWVVEDQPHAPTAGLLCVGGPKHGERIAYHAHSGRMEVLTGAPTTWAGWSSREEPVKVTRHRYIRRQLAVGKGPTEWVWVYEGVLGQEPRKRRSQMTTFAYEVLQTVEYKMDGAVVRKAEIIAREQGVLEEPRREDLLLKYAAQIAERKLKAEDVVVNIRPFVQ